MMPIHHKAGFFHIPNRPVCSFNSFTGPLHLPLFSSAFPVELLSRSIAPAPPPASSSAFMEEEGKA
ncbi:MAG: hypothetical protein K2L60_08415 [Bacteroides sp.]|nr:hypothetical protein [Bacteroides sp.]